MYMLKLLFQQLQITPLVSLQNIFLHKSSWLLGKQPTSWGTAKDDHLGTTGGIRAFVFQGETDATCPWEQLTARGRNVAASFTQSSLNFKAPHRTLFIPWYKKSGLEREGKMVC